MSSTHKKLIFTGGIIILIVTFFLTQNSPKENPVPTPKKPTPQEATTWKEKGEAPIEHPPETLKKNTPKPPIEQEAFLDAWAKRKPNLDRSSLKDIQAWLEEMSLEELIANLDLLAELTAGHPRGDFWDDILLRWGIQDPESALDYAFSNRYGTRAMEGLLTAWVKTDEASMMDYLNTLEYPGQQRDALVLFGPRWIEDDADHVIEWLTQPGHDTLKKETVTYIAGELGRVLLPEEALAKMEPLLAHFESTPAVAEFAGFAVAKDPDVIIEWSKSLPEAQQASVAKNMYDCWFTLHENDAKEWLETHPEEAFRFSKELRNYLATGYAGTPSILE